jgi:hypothetical protein
MRQFVGLETKLDEQFEDSKAFNKNVGETYMNNFWNDRYKDCRVWGLIIVFSNVI